MFKFDVRYSFDNYLEYYKFALIKSKIIRDIVFALAFIGVGIYWIVSKQENQYVSYLCFGFGVLIPLWSLITFPLIKRQLRANLPQIERTHLVVTFNEEEVVYENLSETPEEEKVEDKQEEEKVEEAAEAKEENAPEVTEESTEETKEALTTEEPTVDEENKEATAEESESTEAGQKDDKTFILKYNNFQLVRELDTLFVFYLDRQTIVILPKETFVEGESLEDFKMFIMARIPASRLKFKKNKVKEN